MYRGLRRKLDQGLLAVLEERGELRQEELRQAELRQAELRQAEVVNRERINTTVQTFEQSEEINYMV